MLANFDYQQILSVGLILFCATVVVRLAGFGSSLVAMPLLTPLLGLPVASPLMNLFGVTNFSVVIFQRWKEVTLKDVWRLALMTVLVIPLGIYLIFVVPEAFLRVVLGMICLLYALYGLAKLPMPRLTNPNWAWVYGFWAGVFSGAFNVAGVFVVLYADTQDWEPERFRLNMFSFFLVVSILSLVSRYVAGQLTAQVMQIWLGTTPFLLLGLAVGSYLTRFVNKTRFRQLVLCLLIVLGTRLIYSALG
ncbi:MAG: sulfite exporter TauE/SafE family protein [Ardenticatenaceae bacterium]